MDTLQFLLEVVEGAMRVKGNIEAFQAQLSVKERSAVTCNKCGMQKSAPSEVQSSSLSLAFPVQAQTSGLPVGLSDLIDHHAKNEDVDCRCLDCKSSTATRKLCVTGAENMIIHLKRSAGFGLHRVVHYPVKGLRLEGDTFDLIAVINHHGEDAAGHYTVWVLRDGIWYDVDDEVVTPLRTMIAVKAIKSPKAYALIYSKLALNSNQKIGDKEEEFHLHQAMQLSQEGAVLTHEEVLPKSPKSLRDLYYPNSGRAEQIIILGYSQY